MKKLIIILSLCNLALSPENHDVTWVDHIKNVLTNKVETRLHSAIASEYSAHDDLALQLISSRVYINTINKFGETPLHYAVKHNKPYIVEKLVEAGANINAKGMYGNTPLHIAAMTNNYNIAKLLLCLGANQKINNNRHVTPLEYLYNCYNLYTKKASYLSFNYEGILIMKQLLETIDDSEKPQWYEHAKNIVVNVSEYRDQLLEKEKNTHKKPPNQAQKALGLLFFPHILMLERATGLNLLKNNNRPLLLTTG